jgi:hypothetical protein
MQTGIRKALEFMATEHLDTVIYSISIWTDEAAKRSAISFDTFVNSEATCCAANEGRRQLREKYGRAPADMKRNNNPADFQFRRVVEIRNNSLSGQDQFDDQAWAILERLLCQIMHWAARQCASLRLHPDAELGISTRKDWYGETVRIPVVAGEH